MNASAVRVECPIVQILTFATPIPNPIPDRESLIFESLLGESVNRRFQTRYAGDRERAPRSGAEALPVTSALRRAPEWAVRGQAPRVIRVVKPHIRRIRRLMTREPLLASRRIQDLNRALRVVVAHEQLHATH